MPPEPALGLPLALALGLSLVLLVSWLRARARLRALQRALAASTVKLEQLQTAFQRFAPDDIVEEVIRTGVVRREADRREVTVLFVDIVGFTALSETLPPERLVELLSGYFHVVSRAIVTHRGRVSKFLGDGVMALFGAPEPNPWQALDATRAALALRAALADYNEQLAGRDLPTLRVGLGVHKGPVVAGVIGSDELAEYTVIGDTVNTAARVEGLTHAGEHDLLISGAVRRELDERFTLRALPPVNLRGKQAPMELFAVDGYRDLAPRPGRRA